MFTLAGSRIAPPEGRDPAPELAAALNLLVKVGRAAGARAALPLALRRVLCSTPPSFSFRNPNHKTLKTIFLTPPPFSYP